jgi:hypothetical protein
MHEPRDTVYLMTSLMVLTDGATNDFIFARILTAPVEEGRFSQVRGDRGEAVRELLTRGWMKAFEMHFLHQHQQEKLLNVWKDRKRYDFAYKKLSEVTLKRNMTSIHAYGYYYYTLPVT